MGDDAFRGSRFRMRSNDAVLDVDEKNMGLKYTVVNFRVTLVH